MTAKLSRRSIIGGAFAAPFAVRARLATSRGVAPLFGLPIGLPGRLPGDGFVVRHGYACENTWYNPGFLHTGEDWYVAEGDSGGALIYAIADGEVVFAGSEYPGLVVIVRHAGDLYSMYGHLEYALAVEAGEPVKRGQTLGTVLPRFDGRAPSHLHFEVRTFLTTAEVNGDAPRYPFACGPNCAPGPGYWPIDAPDHPSDQGWRNPAHVIGRRGFEGGAVPADAAVVVASSPPAPSAMLWSRPTGATGAKARGEVALRPGDRFALLDVRAGSEDTRDTSADAYGLWYRVRLPDERTGWLQALLPSTAETGSDGRPSTVQLALLPDAAALG